MAEPLEPAAAGRQPWQAKTVLFKVVKWALFAAVLFFVGRALVRQWRAVSWDAIRLDAGFLVLAAASVLLAKGLAFLPYGLLLGRFCRRPGWLPLMSSVWAAQAAKYVPGKVGSVVGMVMLLRPHGVPGQAVVSTVFIIDGISVILGMMLAIPLTVWEPVRSLFPNAWLWCIPVIGVGLACLHPRVFGWVGNFLLRKFGYQPLAMLPRVRDYFPSVGVMLVQYAVLGLGYWFMTRSMTEVPASSLPMFICVVVLATVAGFLAFFAPGGIGVGEGLLLVLLGPVVGGGIAAILAVVMRLALTLGDLGLAAVGLLFVRRKATQAEAPPGSLRILVVTTSYPRWPGDPSDSVIGGLVAHLTTRPGVEVTVLAPGHAGARPLERADRLEVRRLTYFWPYSSQAVAYGAGIPWNLRRSKMAWLNLPALMAAFAWAIVRHGRRVDLIHAHWGGAGALAILTRPLHRRPVVVTVHGSDWRTTLRPVRWMTQLAVARADAVTTPSEEFVEELRPLRRRPGPCVWLPNGVDFPAAQEINRLRALAAGNGAGCRLVSVGRLIPERRHDLLVRALARLKPRFPSVTLTVIGEGPCAGDLERLAADLGVADALCLTGALPHAQVLEHLCAADLYVSPTTIESFGMAVLEAAAHGLPIVTTRVGYAARLVVEGETGCTVDAGDEEGLVEAIARMLGDPDRLREAGAMQRRRVEDMDLTWTAVTGRLVRLYETLLEASRGGRRR